MNSIETFLLLNFILSFGLGGALYFQNTKSRNSRILAYYFFVIGGICFTLFTTTKFGIDGSHPIINSLSLLFYVLLIALAPMMYVYTKSLCNPKKGSKEFKSIVHFIPSLLLLLLNVISFIVLYKVEEDSDLHILARDVMTYSNFFAIVFVFFLQNALYIYLSLSIYRKHKYKIGQFYSFDEGVDLKWLLTYILGYVVVILSILAHLLIDTLFSGMLMLVIALYVIIIYNKARSQKALPNDSNFKSDDLSDDRSDDKEPINVESKQSIDPELIVVKERLEEYMKSNHPYLDDKLNIYALSQLTETNIKVLSKTINRSYNMNFASYINMHRVTEAKRLLLDPSYDKYTLESLAQETGFNSRSAFNRAFQKNTGMSPTKFKQMKR